MEFNWANTQVVTNSIEQKVNQFMMKGYSIIFLFKSQTKLILLILRRANNVI
jgi:hypothetical protein